MLPLLTKFYIWYTPGDSAGFTNFGVTHSSPPSLYSRSWFVTIRLCIRHRVSTPCSVTLAIMFKRYLTGSHFKLQCLHSLLRCIKDCLSSWILDYLAVLYSVQEYRVTLCLISYTPPAVWCHLAPPTFSVCRYGFVNIHCQCHNIAKGGDEDSYIWPK